MGFQQKLFSFVDNASTMVGEQFSLTKGFDIARNETSYQVEQALVQDRIVPTPDAKSNEAFPASAKFNSMAAGAKDYEVHAIIMNDAWKKYVAEQMQIGLSSPDGGSTDISQTINKRIKSRMLEEAKTQKSTSEFLMLMDQLYALERDIAARYGEYFQLDLLSELEELGLVEQDELDRIRAIEDPDKQREAIAELTQKLIDERKLTPDQLAELKEKLPWLDEWLELRTKAREMNRQQELDIAAGKLSMKNAFTESVAATASSGNVELEKKAEEEITTRSDREEVDTLALGSKLSGLDLS